MVRPLTAFAKSVYHVTVKASGIIAFMEGGKTQCKCAVADALDTHLMPAYSIISTCVAVEV